MNRENVTGDELDSMLADLDSVLNRTRNADGRMDLESPTTPRASSYVSLESSGEESQDTQDSLFQVPTQPSFDATRVLDELSGEMNFSVESGEEDVKVFNGSQSTTVIDTDAGVTQVIGDDTQPTDTKASPKAKKAKRPRNEAIGCLKAIIYVVVVLSVATAMGVFIARAVIDVMGLYKDGTSVRVTVNKGDGTQEVAEMLAEQDIIGFPMVFRAYCRFTGNDAAFHPGDYVVYRGMDYSSIIDAFGDGEMSETVMVMIPEGTTVEGIAELLEENKVCSKDDFYAALETFDYDQYDFLKAISPEKREKRTYLAEGYLFPDTYEFYIDDAASSVIERMIDNFEYRMGDAIQTILASEREVDDIVIAASIVQREAGNEEDMPRVMRVILNRLDKPAEFPRLEMDSTQDYLDGLEHFDGSMYTNAYDTYAIGGMPLGAIGNPGLQALNAAINPSQEPDILESYFFASIIENGTTAFFKDFKEHEAYCIEHGIGMYNEEE